ncbi:MAG TPA: 2Fe-2S iron-sulfur cluster-binding protein [Xanthobacteraceae bacterium]|nr:2Fe-2S iron-sulfur cluster-binding protein [Xanthobacteraceae bacterium]
MSVEASYQAIPAGEARTIGRKENHDSLLARNEILREGDRVTVSVRRSEGGEAGSLQTFEIPYTPSMRVLDALNYLAEHMMPDLAYRWLCGSKMCGTCAVRMNGREVLACWEAVEPRMVIEPLRNMPVIRDLVVDRAPYDKRVAAFEPWLERPQEYAGFPEPLNHRDMKHASKALDCIGCMSCFSACPVVGLGDLTDFAGPAPLVQLAQTALDVRNSPSKVAAALNRSGIFNCVSCYKCEEVCPAKIPIVTSVIEPLKAKAAVVSPKLAHHSLVFRSIVAARGRIDPTELVMRVQGGRVLLGFVRAFRLLVRRKINPIRTLLRRRSAASEAASRLLAGKDKET